MALMLSHFSDTQLPTLLTASLTVVFTLFQALDTVSLTLLQASDVHSLMLFHFSDTKSPTAVAASDTSVVTVSHVLENHAVILPQFWITKTTPATAAATPAITPMTGKRVDPSAVIAGIRPPAAAIEDVSPLAKVITVDIPWPSLPTIDTTGPIAATTPATVRIVFCWLSSRPLHHSAAFWTASPTDSMAGVSDSSSVAPTSAPTSFTLFITTRNRSVASNVASNVVEVASPQSWIVFENSSKDNRPSLIAAVSAGPAFLPNRSMTACIASVSLEASCSCFCRSDSA